MYLIDTNILLEILLERERADEAEQFLCHGPTGTLFFSEFSWYSLGIFLFRQKRYEVFLQLSRDLFESSSIHLVRLTPEHVPLLAAVAQQFQLDFDDAYQYTVAETYNLTIVSFDQDFDRTTRGRKTPQEVMGKENS
ncbi:MAG: type II toxin-antitoxin system VapC family toxin [Candidatus Atribacteria bacterium]|nr:type II toxin-antitoxin system VapC family toxin [Candidatus Atribacteria bacterium]